MSPVAIARLLDRAKAGILDAGEQYELAVEFMHLRYAAVQAGDTVREMCRRLDEAGV